MKKALLGSLVSAALLTSFNLSAASASQAVDAQAATDNASKVSQQKIDNYADSAESALAQYKAALRQVDSLRTYNEQVGKMVDSQSSELASMQRQIAQIDQTSTEVVPLMLKMIDSLEQFVALDLPFQKVEREDRVAALTDLMNRADVTISEKYRKILEAYQIEEGFSRTIESYKASLAKDGGEKTYEFLRVGRIALLYQSPDGNETGMWNKKTRQWEELPQEYRSAVEQGLRIAKKQAPPPSSSCRFKLRRKHHERNQTCHRLADRGRYPDHPAGDRRRETGGPERPAQSGQGRQHHRIPAQQGAGSPLPGRQERAGRSAGQGQGRTGRRNGQG